MSLLQNNDAEMSVLGSAMIKPQVLKELQALGIKASSFYHPAHGLIWNALVAVGNGDIVLVMNWLKSQNQDQDVGGDDYLIQIMEAAPSAANGIHYGKIVLECAKRRALHSAASALMESALNEPSFAVLTAQASAVPHAVPSTGEKGKTFAEIKLGKVVRGLSTGFPGLDNLISTNGHPRGQMTMIVATSKGGKTTLMLDMMLHDLKRDRRVCYGTFADLDEEGIKQRMMLKVCGIGERPANLDQAAAFDKAESWLDAHTEGRIYDGFADDDPSVEAFCAWVEAEHMKIPWDKVYVDYAQELRSTSKDARYSPEQNQSECARAMVHLARRLNIPVIVGSQITESKDGGKGRTKWSRAWEEKAGWVLVIDQVEGGHIIEVNFSRFGPQSSKDSTVGEYVKLDPTRLRYVGRGL